MNDLDDLSICKRLAEIVTLNTGQSVVCHHNKIFIDNNLSGQREFNPLTDDGLCFQLMVKHDLDIIAPYRKNNETTWEAQIFSKDYADAFQIYDKSPNRAICLAIIEAHKES
jgi:hypothetical protein